MPFAELLRYIQRRGEDLPMAILFTITGQLADQAAVVQRDIDQT
jgi:hypothetical protein